MTTAYEPEAQTCDGTVGTPDPQECGFTQVSNDPLPTHELYESFETTLIVDFPAQFQQTIETTSTPTQEDLPPIHLLVGGVTTEPDSGFALIQPEAPSEPSSGGGRDVTVGAGGPIGPH